MEVIIKEEARQDLSELDEEIRDKILNQIEKLESDPNPEKSIFIEMGDIELFRLKLQAEDRNSKLNHRIFYQIRNNKVYIRGVFHRHKGYGKETEDQLEERI